MNSISCQWILHSLDFCCSRLPTALAPHARCTRSAELTTLLFWKDCTMMSLHPAMHAESSSAGISCSFCESPRQLTAKLTSSTRSHAGTVEEAVNKAFSHETTKPVVIPAGGSGYKVGFLSEYPLYPPITVHPLQSLQVLDGEADAYVHVTKIKKWGLSRFCLIPFFPIFHAPFQIFARVMLCCVRQVAA